MSHFVLFQGFGRNGREVSVAWQRVTHLTQITADHSYGVEIGLDSGAQVIVSGYEQDVRKKLEAAATQASQA